MAWRDSEITKETKEAFQRQLGDRNIRLPKSLKALQFREYLINRYEHFPEGILFKKGTNHDRASVDGGSNWIPLGERHPSKGLKYPTMLSVVEQLDTSRMRLMQAQRGEQALDPKQWAEEVRAMSLIANPKIYEKPNENSFYSGNILHVDKAGRFCAQKIGERSIVLHDARKFPDGLPQKGDAVRIRYRDGAAKVSSIRENTRERTSQSR